MLQVGNYTLYKLLGKGSFGEVYLTTKKNCNIILATKKLDKKQTDRPSIKKYFDNEISIMRELNHPNIIKFHELLASKSHYYVVMEYCNGGDLTGCLRKYKSIYHRPFSEEIVQYLMRQIIEAIKVIHSHKIIHRDIKLDNILVSFENDYDKNNVNMMKAQIKIIDFGLATKLGTALLTYTALGSPVNMDPIILKKYNKAGGYEQLQGYNEKADIWSLGTVFYELLTGEALFKVKDMKELVNKVEKGVYTIPTNMNFSKESLAFLNSMLQYDANKRLSAEELSNHFFLSKNISDFSQVDLNILSTKIDDNGLLNINVRQNETIFEAFNKDMSSKEINPFSNANISKKNERKYSSDKNMNSYKFGKNMKTQENFYDHGRITEGNNNRNNNNMQIQIPKAQSGKRRLSFGFISPMSNNLQRFEIDNNDNKQNDINVNSKEGLEKYLNGLFDEYNAAKEYFKENKLPKREEDASQKCMQIQHAKLQFEQGYPIYSSYLPGPITPEYIYGCTTEERTNIFRKILSKFISQRNEIESRIRETILKLKELDPENYAKMKNNAMPQLTNDKTKLDKLKKVIEAFKEKCKNIWIPPPDIDIKMLNSQVGQNSKVNNEYKMRIKLGKIDYQKDDVFLNAILIIDGQQILNRKVQLKSIGDFNEDWCWTLNSEEWSKLDKSNMKIELFFGPNKDRSAVKFHIGNIKNGNIISFNCPIELYSAKLKVKLNIYICAILPENQSNQNEANEIVNIKTIYPEFKGKSKYTEKIPNLIINN